MKTDYTSIAPRYDHTRERFEIPPDEVLGDLIAALGRRVVAVDIGCGTGNYLKAQGAAASEDVDWHESMPRPTCSRLPRRS